MYFGVGLFLKDLFSGSSAAPSSVDKDQLETASTVMLAFLINSSKLSLFSTMASIKLKDGVNI